MAKASMVAVKTANLLELQTAQNERIEAKLDKLLALANAPAKVAAVPVEPKPAKAAAE